jgi:tetratricopeptide (TPR) repeat protein
LIERNASAAFDAALKAYDAQHWDSAHRLALDTLRLDPRHAAALYLAGSLEKDAGDFTSAIGRLSEAAALAPAHPGIRRTLGQAQAAVECWPEAAEAYREALRLGLASAELLAELGLALHHLDDFDAALMAFRESLAIEPNNADVYNNLAVTLNRKHDYEAAASAYENAIRLDPKNLGALSNLAMLYEQMNQLEDAEATSTRGLELAPEHGVFNLVAARCERRQGEPEKAVTRLRRILNSARTELPAKRALEFELGRDYDLLGDFESAWNHFVEGNRIAHDIWPDMQAAGVGYLAELEAKLAELNVQVLQELAARPSAPARSPVFLVSFPRSGTTLMDTILGAHPDVAVMEEEPPLFRVQQALQQGHGADPKTVLNLTDSDVENLRELYWDEADRYLDASGRSAKVIVDKNPFHSPHVALIHRLFPQAKFVFAQRHPLAVVLSCFMQPFGRNPALANFTEVRSSAEQYRLVMKLWLRFRSHLPLKVHDLRYESLVADKEAKLRETLDFLGLAWHDSLADHVAHARKRGRIYTPSYHQVSQPIYTDSINRWRNYERYLGEARELLRPFIAEFGYDL